MTGQTISTDILIIGTGPAGATASLFLAKMGIAHTILDAAQFPRDKVCGDGLDLKVIRVLRHLEPDTFEQEFIDREIYRRLNGEIRLCNLMMGLSPHLYERGLNLLAPNPAFQWSFRNRVGGWMKTAYETAIEVNI